MRLSHALHVQRRDVVALVGAGGKTSAMFRLAEELAALGWTVVTTTTTHIGADQVALAPRTITIPDHGTGQPAEHLVNQLTAHSPTLLISGLNPQIDRAEGPSSEFIDAVARLPSVDAVINEADGARSLPFKAPADHEPVIPSSTTLVVAVVGVDVVGKPLDAAHVHRPERVAALTGAELGQFVTPEMIATVLTDRRGGLKDIPDQARVAVLINKVHTEAELATAERLARLLLSAPGIERVAIGAVQAPEPMRRVKSRVAAVVLAAGESRRFGQLKQLLPWGEGKILLSHAVDVALASRAEQVLVVLGCQAEACRAALGERPVTVVVNPDWESGQSTSVRAGLAALPQNVGAVLFQLADQPGVTPQVIDALIERHAVTLAPVVWPEYQGQRGNPVLFDRVTFPKLQQLTGDVGGKPLLLAYARANQVERVTVNEPGVLLDIDTPEDLPKTK